MNETIQGILLLPAALRPHHDEGVSAAAPEPGEEHVQPPLHIRGEHYRQGTPTAQVRHCEVLGELRETRGG